jgi:mRNA-degrading endonuclease RelE of RelBE toxin-antitoxin system
VNFRIAETFTDSLAKLTGEEQKAVKTTAFDLQLNPATSGMQFHKLDRANDKNFWSVRFSRDIRLIVYRTAGSLLLCYVDHHDPAYDWAEPNRQGSLDAHDVRDQAVRIPVDDREAFLQWREETGY